MTTNLLVLASYFKGERFMRQAHAMGARVHLLTVEKLLGKEWPRESLVDVYAQANKATLADTLKTVSYLARKIPFDRVVPMDDFDVETAAALREHLRLPGQGDSAARYFRDKLAMRMRAREIGLLVPDFVHVLNHDAVHEFTQKVSGPWMYKPRSQAGATGIKKMTSAEQLWSVVNAAGDEQSSYLLEAFTPGDVYHVDSIVDRGKVVFAETHRCGAPPFDVAHGGGIFTSATVLRDSADDLELRRLNALMLPGFGLETGAAHVEFIKANAGPNAGKFFMLECGARVGGAHIAEMIEAATGLNPWEEWAKVELQTPERPYVPAQPRREYGGLAICLAREEHPDLSAYADPEIFYRAPEKSHVGLVVRSPDAARATSLVESYRARFSRDFLATLPAAEFAAN